MSMIGWQRGTWRVQLFGDLVYHNDIDDARMLKEYNSSRGAKGYDLEKAVEKGEEFINKAIALGAEYEFGHGYGPVHPCFMEDKVIHERIYN